MAHDQSIAGVAEVLHGTRTPAFSLLAAHPTTHLNPHGSHQIANSGYTVLVTKPDGTFAAGYREGLWDYETRVISEYRMTLDGRQPTPVAGGLIESDTWLAHLRVPRPGRGIEGPALPQDTLEVALARRIGHGMEERIRVTNHSMAPVETEIELNYNTDFADMQESDVGREQTGSTGTRWDGALPGIVFDYHVEFDSRALHRGSRVRVVRADSDVAYENRTLRFPLRLPPRGSWTAVLHVESLVDDTWRKPSDDVDYELASSPHARHRPGSELGSPPTRLARERDNWRRQRPHLAGAGSIFCPAFERAAEDLFALRNQDLEDERGAWVLNAGLPVYNALFGRDILTSSWQGALLGPQMLRGALRITARTQATRDSAWHDEEPGKLIHEAHRGPLAELGIVPTRHYYGTVTTPAMFVLALSEYWHWTGDASLLRRYRDTALRTFEWADRYADMDGDGFLEYRQRSSRGLKNQAWKDSNEAIRYADGSVVPNPIATVEEQAYHFIALQRMAEILVALEDDRRADEFLEKARRLRDRFEREFWMEDEGFYAMALDPDKRPVRSIGSNAGHALGAGIVRKDRARRVANRLLAPDLFNGWGVRTLSNDHPSYNPFAYHLGTVWPVENATFALGMKRYGLYDYAEKIILGQCAAAAYFDAQRLPEVLGGHSRDDSPIPTLYPNANSPQAWSASATVQIVQLMLGLYPFAPARTLAVVRPRLPESLPSLMLRNVRVGDATVSLRFERRPDGTTDWDVVQREGKLIVTEVAPPQDLNADEEGVGEVVKAWALDHAPGRIARALRIALGIEEHT